MREGVAVELLESVDDLISGNRASVVIIGGGGTGKSRIVRKAMVAAEAAGLSTRVVRGRRLDSDEAFAALDDVLELDLLERLLGSASRVDRLAARQALIGGLSPGLLVVDDAQWVDPQSVSLLVSAASSVEPGGFRMLVAHRPRTAQQHLAALDEALVREERPNILGRLGDEEAAKEFANSVVGANSTDVVDRLVAQTCGQAELIASVITTATVDPTAFSAWLEGAPCPATLLEAVRSKVGHLTPAARDLVLALSFGASPTSEELPDLLRFTDDDAIAVAANELEDEGLLMSDANDVIPLVAEAATLLQAPVERRRHHRRFAEVLERRGGSAVLRAEHMAAAGAPQRDLMLACIDAADELIDDAPSLALSWIERAADAGADPMDLASRRVVAHVRDGRAVEALRAAEPLFRPGAQDRLEGLKHAAIAFVQSRRPLQAASVLTQIAPRLEGEAGRLEFLSAGICLIVGGRVWDGRDSLQSDSRASTATDPAIEVARLVGDAVLSAIGGEMDSAIATAAEACELELAALAEQRLAVPAAAVAPVLAVYGADLDLAHRLASRAVATPAATDAQRQSRALRSELISVWQGRADQSADTSQTWDDLSPSDRLLATAVAAGAARRSNDLGRMRAHHDHIREVLLHPPDLLSLPAYGEVIVSAARLGDVALVSEARITRDRLLGQMSGLAIVDAATCWTDLQVLVVSEAKGSMQGLGDRIEALGSLPGRLGDLVTVMQAWCSVLERTADPASIEHAARLLQGIGFRWEATRLVGAAAIREDDGKAAKSLLATARELRASLPKPGSAAAPLSARLSSRELEVAELMAGGNTYKEIGARLYISPKTVEHHVAKIRQRLDVTSRAEMLEVLRTELISAEG